jgi:peptide/nickel transport system permease protein
MVFLVIRLLPGDPLIIYVAQTAQLEAMNPEMIEQLRVQYGLDKPITTQYINWLVNIFHGDFGESIFLHEDVSTLMKDRFPITVHLTVLSLIFAAVAGIFVGVITAVRRGKWLDKILTPLTYVGVTIPVFFLAILMIYTFGLRLGWLPLTGYTSPFDNFWLSTRQLIMPVFCLSLFGIAANARQMRSSVLEVISQDYIRTAWSKGLSERRIIMKHALKNSLIPVITLIGVSVGILIGGSVLVEQIFAISGVGRLLVSSIFSQDYLVVQAITLVISVAILIINLLVDISYSWLDPRIRYG